MPRTSPEECVRCIPVLQKLVKEGRVDLRDATEYAKVSLKEAGEVRGGGYEGNMPSEAIRFPLKTPLTRGAKGGAEWAEEVKAWHGTVSHGALEEILLGREPGLKSNIVGWKPDRPNVVCTSRSYWLAALHYGAHFDYFEEGDPNPAGVLVCALELRVDPSKRRILHPQTIPDRFWGYNPAYDPYWNGEGRKHELEWWMAEEGVQLTALTVRKVRRDNPAICQLRDNRFRNRWRVHKGDPSSTSRDNRAADDGFSTYFP